LKKSNHASISVIGGLAWQRTDYLAGAFRRIGRAEVADEILQTMKAADYDVRESDPFTESYVFGTLNHTVAPIVGRLQAMWEAMRGDVLTVFPEAPGLPKIVRPIFTLWMTSTSATRKQHEGDCVDDYTTAHQLKDSPVEKGCVIHVGADTARRLHEDQHVLASHQTGWTGLIACTFDIFAPATPEMSLATPKTAMAEVARQQVTGT